jgi:hypothetical protein
MTELVANAVFPGNRAATNWAWALLCIWFFGVPLVVGAFALYTKLSGKAPPGLRGEEEEKAQGS